MSKPVGFMLLSFAFPCRGFCQQFGDQVAFALCIGDAVVGVFLGQFDFQLRVAFCGGIVGVEIIAEGDIVAPLLRVVQYHMDMVGTGVLLEVAFYEQQLNRTFVKAENNLLPLQKLCFLQKSVVISDSDVIKKYKFGKIIATLVDFILYLYTDFKNSFVHKIV